MNALVKESFSFEMIVFHLWAQTVERTDLQLNSSITVDMQEQSYYFHFK